MSVFAGDPDGPTTVRYMQIVHNFQKNAARNGPLIAFPVASMNRLANDPQAPFDRNGNGAVDNGPGCADDDPSTPCDLGGFDGFDTRTVRARFPGAPTLDSSLTNEQRALLGCGPFYGVRCDSAARETTTLQFPQSGPFGGLDFMNMEASVLVQSWLGVEGTQPGQTTSDNLPQPGTIGPLGAAQATGAGSALRANVPFLGGPACTRFVASQGLVKLPGCRGIEALSVVYSDPNGIPGDADDVPTRVSVAFEAGLSAVDRRLHPRRRDPPARRRAERAGDRGRRVGGARARARAVQRRDHAARGARDADRGLRREPEPDPGREPRLRRARALRGAHDHRERRAAARVHLPLAAGHARRPAADPPDRGLHRLADQSARRAELLRVGQPRSRRGAVRGHRAAVPERARGVLVQLPRVPRDLVVRSALEGPRRQGPQTRPARSPPIRSASCRPRPTSPGAARSRRRSCART